MKELYLRSSSEKGNKYLNYIIHTFPTMHTFKFGSNTELIQVRLFEIS